MVNPDAFAREIRTLLDRSDRLGERLPPALRQAYDAARARLIDADRNFTSQFRSYLQYARAYDERKQAWDDASHEARGSPLLLQAWPGEGVSYRREADAAMDRWVVLGFKHEIEAAVATLEAQGQSQHG